MRHRRVCAALIAALAFMAGAASAHAQATVEATLMEVRIGQAASLALRAERMGARLWLPIAELAAALELEVVRRSPNRVEVRRWPSRAVVVFDRDSMLVRSGTSPRIALAAGALRTTDGELMVDVTTVEAVLRTPLEISFSDLVVALPSIDSLPIGRRIARERARARLNRHDDRYVDDIAPLARPLADGTVLDYSLSVPLTGTQRDLGWSSALGVDVLGGSLEVSTGAVSGGTRLPTLSSWTGVWRTGRKLSQMRLGDGLGSGPSARFGRGLMVTNAPYARPSFFGLQTLRGDLPPGWTIEAYRNGELVAVDTVGRSSGYQLQLPVLYGENPVDLLAVGPFGQTRALSENLRIGGDLLPANRSEYSVSFAQCRLRQQCVTAGTLDFRVGLTDRWTMRVGIDGLARDSVGWRQAPYFAFIGTPLPAISVQLDAAALSRTHAAVNIQPSRQLRLSMEQSWFSEDPIDPLITSRRSAQTSVFGSWNRLDDHQTSVDMSLDRSQFVDGGALTRARIGLGTQYAALRLQPYLRYDASSRGGTSRPAAGVEVTVLPNASRGPYVGAALLRLIGEVDAGGRSVRQAMTLSMPMPGAFRMDAGVALQRGAGSPLATLTISRDLNALRSYTNAAMGNGSMNAAQNIQGSAIIAPGARRPQFVTGPSLQRAGVAGIVFLDRNANGRRDPGESPVPGVSVQVGTGFATSDADGRYRVWNLVPFVPMPVVIDSTSLPSPLWIPTVSHASIEVGPNRFEPLDIPLVTGGVIEGRIVWNRIGGRSLPPVPIIVSDEKGRVVARAATFSDGEFVLFGVRPGSFTVRVDSAWLAAQDLRAEPRVTTLGSSDEGVTVRLPAIPLTSGSEQHCAPGGGTHCGGTDDELRDSGSEDGIRLSQSDFERRDLRAASAVESEQHLATATIRAGDDQLARDVSHRRPIRLRIGADDAAAAAFDDDAQGHGNGSTRDRAEGQWTASNGRRRTDGRGLCSNGTGRRDSEQQAQESDGTEATMNHGQQSRQLASCARVALHRADSLSEVRCSSAAGSVATNRINPSSPRFRVVASSSHERPSQAHSSAPRVPQRRSHSARPRNPRPNRPKPTERRALKSLLQASNKAHANTSGIGRGGATKARGHKKRSSDVSSKQPC